MKTVIVIPARLESSRFPNKILYPLHGIPMIEHVRRRCLMATSISEVFVATPNIEIKKEVEANGGKVIMTSDSHDNGTSRVAEAIRKIDCENVILVQGDEPLIFPNELDQMCLHIEQSSDKYYAWNGVSPIEHQDDLADKSIVKCSIINGRICFCFRKSPSIAPFDKQKNSFKKVMGLIAFKKSFLIDFSIKKKTPLESMESIEQLRIIENEFILTPISFKKNFPSVNLPKDVPLVLEILEQEREQNELLRKISKNQ